MCNTEKLKCLWSIYLSKKNIEDMHFIKVRIANKISEMEAFFLQEDVLHYLHHALHKALTYVLKINCSV